MTLATSRGFGTARITFWRVVGGNAVSAFGSYLNLVALGLFAVEVTGTAFDTGVFMALRIGSAFLAGLVAGPLMTCLDRKVLMVGADLSACVGLVLFVIAPAANQDALLFVLAALLGFSSTMSSVVLRTSVPDIVGVQARVRANGLLVTGRSLAMVCGFAAAGVIVGFTGYTAAFIVDAVTFLVSAANLALLPLAGRAGQCMLGPGLREDPPTTSMAWTPLLIGLVLVRTVDNFGSASHQVGMPIYAKIINPTNAAAYVGQFWACWAVGSLLAHQCVARTLRGRALGERAFVIGTCLMSALFILVFVGLPWPLPLAAALAAGLADGFTQIMYDSRLQALPDAQRGQMLSLAAATETSALGVGMVFSASLLDAYSPPAVVTGMHGTVLVLAIGYLALLMRHSMTSSTAPGTRPKLATNTPDTGEVRQ